MITIANETARNANLTVITMKRHLLACLGLLARFLAADYPRTPCFTTAPPVSIETPLPDAFQAFVDQLRVNITNTCTC